MTSKAKELMKKGWHPEKPGTTLKGQVSGLLHRNKSSDEKTDHVARPISQLRDPASFAPPPKRTGSGLAPAPPPVSTPRKVITAPSKYQDPRGPPVDAPIYKKQLDDEQNQEQDVVEEDAPPPQPYRANTTGLATNHLPPPPGRRDGADGRSPPPLPPPSYQAAVGGNNAGPPSLPPRLPPRTNSSSPSPAAISPASTGNSLLSQGAVNRLGAAGVSVPGFGIGRSSPANQTSQPPPQPPRPSAASSTSQMNELQNRFSKLGTSSTSSTPPPSEGTTWAQKQSALKTASAFQKDPSSVSFSDAKAAASTANNFRQRHGEQVASGLKTANNLNQKYGLADKVGKYTGGQGAQDQSQGIVNTSPSPVPSLAGKKKPPPPPPPKKKNIGNPPPIPSHPADDDAPPPIPMATRPQF